MCGLVFFPEYRARGDVLVDPLLRLCGLFSPLNSYCALSDVLTPRFPFSSQTIRGHHNRKLLSSLRRQVRRSWLTV